MGGIAFALLFFFPLLASTIPNPTRQETTTTAAITMPAMAPEDRCEDDVEAWALLDGLDSGRDDPEVLGLVDGLDASEDEDVVASTPGQPMGSRPLGNGYTFRGNRGRSTGNAA